MKNNSIVPAINTPSVTAGLKCPPLEIQFNKKKQTNYGIEK